MCDGGNLEILLSGNELELLMNRYYATRATYGFWRQRTYLISSIARWLNKGRLNSDKVCR